MSKLWDKMRYGGPKVAREYFLNPKGLVPKKICTLPREQRNYDFLNWKLTLYRTGPGKETEPNVLTFQIDKRMTKPEVKQYLTKVYDLPVDRVNTAIIHGEIKKNM
jgi:ribosomal protein L23